MDAIEAIAVAEPTVEYPCDNDEPMAETREQYRALTYAVAAIEKHLQRHWQAAEGDHLVAGDFLLYYEQGNPKACVAPDVMLAYGVALPPRTPYLLWEAGKPPDLVMEVASPSTVKPADQTFKHRLYRRLGIAEYWQYDPHGHLLDPRLQGWSLHAGRYEPIASQYDPEQDATMIYSEVLDTYWGSLDARDELRLWNPKEDSWILPSLQEAGRADQAEARAAQEAGRADQAEARAAQEAGRADQAEARAAQEAERANQADARAAKAEAKLKRLGLDLGSDEF